MFVAYLFLISTGLFSSQNTTGNVPDTEHGHTPSKIKGSLFDPINNCLSFEVSQGTGCSYLCSWCAQNLGTSNFYFTDGVCQYSSEQGMCIGNPWVGKTYTCCSLN